MNIYLDYETNKAFKFYVVGYLINESFEQTAKLYPENEILEKVKNEIVSNWEFHFNKINELYNIEISMNKVQE